MSYWKTGLFPLAWLAMGIIITPLYHYNRAESNKQTVMQTTNDTTMEATRAYLGMWVTKDGHVRQELLPENRYDEARGTRQSAYTGSYKVTGNTIDYKDDTGFTADGEFKNDVLYHGGMVFYKEVK